jgi:Ni,Fe-hydrogenase III component G
MTQTDENPELALAAAAELLQPWTQSSKSPEPDRLDITMAAADLRPAVHALIERRWGYLSAITGLDPGPATGELEVLYHFCAGRAIVTLRVRAPRDGATVPSVCEEIPSATFFERELGEMFGIIVAGTPDDSRLFLPDDWPAGVYPLRK